MSTLSSYRVPIVRDIRAYPGDPALCETVRVKAANATDAALAARWVTGAQVALTPERLVQTPAVDDLQGDLSYSEDRIAHTLRRAA